MQIIPGAFFCTTPYQIITSVVLQRTLNERADIYIVPQFKLAEECAERLRRWNIFQHVILVDTSAIEKYKSAKNKFLLHMGIVKQYFRVDEIVESFLLPDTTYQRIYTSSKAFVPRMAYLYCIRHHMDTELVCYDDGEGSYYNRYLMEATPVDKIIRRLLFGKKAVDQRYRLYLYQPELFSALNGNRQTGKTLTIPHIIQEEPVHSCISDIFNIVPENIMTENVIILDVIKQGKYSSTDIKKLFSIYDDVQKLFTREETIIKKHPRDKSEELSKFKCYENYSIPFECLCTQMDMNEKVLIAISSTAVIIPKILLGQEPVVILLYKLIRQINRDEEYLLKQDRFYRMCQMLYSSPKRFFIPETYDELTRILNTLSESA